MPFCNKIGKFENVECGLVHMFNNLLVPVPLKNVNLDIKVVDFVGQVTITQEYVNRYVTFDFTNFYLIKKNLLLIFWFRDFSSSSSNLFRESNPIEVKYAYPVEESAAIWLHQLHNKKRFSDFLYFLFVFWAGQMSASQTGPKKSKIKSYKFLTFFIE